MPVEGAQRSADGEEDRPSWWRRVHERLHANRVTGLITKVVVSVVGLAVILAGVVLSGPGVPGPGFLVIIAGLAILATEWEWAERLLQWAKEKALEAKRRAEEMDPRVRRRRILLGAGLVVLLVALAGAYVWWQGWPGFVLGMWDQAQSMIGFLPELPGS